jgi:hypothetical protein
MANAAVDKLKNLGLRHGEKAVVGLTATLFFVFAVLAVIKPTIDLRPEQLKTAAEQAQTNLQKPQDPKDILARLEEGGLKNPDFEKMVVNQQANALKPADYRVKLDWVTPEPGAGLIRDQPELIAPTELAAFPGRGGLLMYKLNEKGEREIDAGKHEAGKAPRKKRGSRPAGSYGGGYGVSGGSMPGAAPTAEKSEEAKKRDALEAERKKRSFAGTVDAAKEKEEAKAEEATEPQGPWKEETKGKRWIVITGVIDNAQLKKNWLQALKNPAIAYPNYKRLDLERQTRQTDGSWSDWAAIDRNKSYEVLDNLPEIDTEYVPETKRPEALNDPLPFLRAGYWTGVHVARLVPAEVREAKAKTNPGGYYPGMSTPYGTSGGSEMGMSGMGMPGMAPGMSRGGSMPGSEMRGSSGGAGVEGSISAEETNFTKSEDPTLMVRSLDFTVEPEQTYRFRVRIVVVNPNKDHTDVNPGVDVESKELLGPWSDPTNEVEVPADVAAYAQAPVQTDRRHDQVAFQVIRWVPETGQTVLKIDDAGPGEIVGEFGSVLMPTSEGGGATMTGVDFNSRAVVLDTLGGREMIPDFGVERIKVEIPAVAMVVQKDGSVAIRSQAGDRSNAVREDMEVNYRQAIEDSGKKREKGSGSRFPGMPGSGSRGGS